MNYNKLIEVHDGLVDLDLQERIHRHLQTARWTYGEISTSREYVHLACELSDEPLFAELCCKFEPVIPKIEAYDLARVYVNAHTFSDAPVPHQDTPNREDRTVLYYANLDWDIHWGGETVFFAHNEIVRSVIPKPGRIVIFPSDIYHCARVQNKAGPHMRYTVAYKLDRNR